MSIIEEGGLFSGDFIIGDGEFLLGAWIGLPFDVEGLPVVVLCVELDWERLELVVVDLVGCFCLLLVVLTDT